MHLSPAPRCFLTIRAKQLFAPQKRKPPPRCGNTSRRVLVGIRQRPTLPGRRQPSTIGAEGLNFCVRNGNRWIPFAIAAGILPGPRSSAQGFSTAPRSLPQPQNCTTQFLHMSQTTSLPSARSFVSYQIIETFDRLVSPSSIHYCTSTGDLSPGSLPGVSRALALGHFFLRLASRLDAFSVYPSRTSLPCYAVGTTTVAPVVRPLRSSRTRSSSSHVSFAHDG